MIPAFADVLAQAGLDPRRAGADHVQVNVGPKCDLACRHCHLEAGPHRTETMPEAIKRGVVDFVARVKPGLVDLTGGAPELDPALPEFLEALAPKTPALMLRSNLTALFRHGSAALWRALESTRTAITASLPGVSAGQVEAQRGAGVFQTSIDMLKELNRRGWGVQESGLALNLVSNPAGAFLPPCQGPAEKRAKAELARRAGVSFTRLFVFANAPLGRFKRWLETSGNYPEYMEKLREAFNPATLDAVMCRGLVSVDHRGRLYDCDFHLAADVPPAEGPLSIFDDETPRAGTRLAWAEHCYACTAGAGFT